MARIVGDRISRDEGEVFEFYRRTRQGMIGPGLISGRSASCGVVERRLLEQSAYVRSTKVSSKERVLFARLFEKCSGLG